MQSLTATYSPEDNKLRLYSMVRLDGETYERIKEAGFRFAPKQDLFVAPKWTPDRADLLLELCGDIGDEDTSLAERAGDRADRFEDYRERRTSEANTARAAVEKIVEHIPFGQPILVGHHSERRARKDQERIETGMRRAISLWDTADYWKRRAAGALRNASYKERPDVRARRIKGIEADHRKAKRAKDEATKFAGLWSRDGLNLERALNIAGFDRVYLRDGSGAVSFISIWSALSDGKVTVAEAAKQAIATHTRTIERSDRWLAHYNNRLSYERAMLDESGGLPADNFAIEVGGEVLVSGEWLSVLRVTRRGGKIVSVRTNARFVPIRKVEEIADYRARAGEVVADVEAPPASSPANKAVPCDESSKFDAMRDTLRAGVQVVAVPQLLPTPTALAARMVKIAGIEEGDEVLEPSFGTQRILRAIRAYGPRCKTTAVEVSHALVNKAGFVCADTVLCADFLALDSLGKFDRIIMNPPFANAVDIKHIERAASLLRPGGRLVAICAAGPRQAAALRPLADKTGGLWEELPDGTFAESGTNVRTVLLTINA
ncbi:DUF3560 domain-containing protein [Pseudomonas sp. DCB_CB]|uniref:DUF3560 domain-containing protein n=1 Tax=unclassified Pseudomonas TaxID=196821 RepID=UPI002248A051|nr:MULTISPECIES: DUF3560 domain-containing protein [unclassified Pseudomonas]MCX2694976.1 DUF3560 domain-containing protein [Pseudomonas sp. DCB_BZ]MCX2860065.1 DUF3560 domain-containing protein [Pseudomonas sp. DCB_CB]